MITQNKQYLKSNKGGKRKTRKNKTKVSKKTKKKSRKQMHILPDSDKTIWSSDIFGERQVINYKKYISKLRVDNLNPINGKFKDSIRDEYIRRINIQINKSKASKKLYQSKSANLKKMSNEKIVSLYKSLLK